MTHSHDPQVPQAVEPDPITGWRPGLCPACSGRPLEVRVVRDGITLAGVRTCSSCGTIFTVAPVSRVAAGRVVNLSARCACPGDGISAGRGFGYDLDVEIPTRVARFHGIACRVCRKVLQAG